MKVSSTFLWVNVKVDGGRATHLLVASSDDLFQQLLWVLAEIQHRFDGFHVFSRFGKEALEGGVQAQSSQ